MSKIEIKNAEGKKVNDLELNDSVFGIEPNIPVMHQVVTAFLANLRQGTHATKTRGQVSGGGRKPWRQKGTGRARQGTIRAPHWRGGGVVFGPSPRSYYKKVNRKVTKLALRSALSSKLADNELIVVDQIKFEKPSTKQALAMLKALEVKGSVTVVFDEYDYDSMASFCNIPGVEPWVSDEITTYDILNNKNLVMTEAAARRLGEVLA